MHPGKDYIGVGCGALIVNEKKQILLLKRSRNTRGGGFWARPGGAVKLGEKLEDAVKREVKEEIGVDIEILRFLDYSQHFVNGEHWVAFGFLAKIKNGEIKNLEPKKHKEVKWFSLDKLPKNIADYTMTGIEAYKKLLNANEI